jgi:hypothetical protein
MLDLAAAEKERNGAGMENQAENSPTPAPEARAKAPETAPIARRTGVLAIFLGLVAGALAGAGMIVSAPAWQKFLPPELLAPAPDLAGSPPCKKRSMRCGRNWPSARRRMPWPMPRAMPGAR